MRIKQSRVELNKPYRHCEMTNRVFIPVQEITPGMFKCNNMTLQDQVIIPEEKFFEGLYIKMPGVPSGVRWLSFDYWQLNGAIAILKNGGAIYWHGSLQSDSINTCYETFVPETIIKQNLELFKKTNLFNHFEQLYKILQGMGINMRQAKPHNYTIDELKNALNTGILKPFPGQTITENSQENSKERNLLEINGQGTDKERAISAKMPIKTSANHEQLSLF